MKTLKDFAHLYIGCEVIINEDAPVCEGMKGTFVGYRYSDQLLIQFSETNKRWVDINDCKIILRKLSSMTDEEMEYIVKLNSDLFLNMVFDTANEHGFSFEFQYATSKRRRWERIRFDELNQFQFLYLLKQGFDLFNLNESGLAVYKEDLK